MEDRKGTRGLSESSIKLLFEKQSRLTLSRAKWIADQFSYINKEDEENQRKAWMNDLRLDDTDDKRYAWRLFWIKIAVIKMTIAMSKKKAIRVITIEWVQLLVLSSEIEKLANRLGLFIYCILVFPRSMLMISMGVLVFDCSMEVVVLSTFIKAEVIISVVEL